MAAALLHMHQLGRDSGSQAVIVVERVASVVLNRFRCRGCRVQLVEVEGRCRRGVGMVDLERDEVWKNNKRLSRKSSISRDINSGTSIHEFPKEDITINKPNSRWGFSE